MGSQSLYDNTEILSVISSEDDLSLSPSSFSSFWFHPEISSRDQDNIDHRIAHAQDDPEDISWVGTMLNELPDRSAREHGLLAQSALPEPIRDASARPLSAFGTIVNDFAEPLYTSHLVQSGYPEGSISALASATADREIDRTEVGALMPVPNSADESPIITSERTYEHLFDSKCKTKRYRFGRKSFPVRDETVTHKPKILSRMLGWVRDKMQAIKGSFKKHRTPAPASRLSSSSASEGNNLF